MPSSRLISVTIGSMLPVLAGDRDLRQLEEVAARRQKHIALAPDSATRPGAADILGGDAHAGKRLGGRNAMITPLKISIVKTRTAARRLEGNRGSNGARAATGAGQPS
jgi:hypothetical protein